MRLRNKKIGKNYQISCVMYRKDTARIYVYVYNKSTREFDKYLAGEYPQTSNNQKALNIYNSTKTVKDVKKLIEWRKK